MLLLRSIYGIDFSALKHLHQTKVFTLKSELCHGRTEIQCEIEKVKIPNETLPGTTNVIQDRNELRHVTTRTEMD
jgi:hypothetical protein